MELDILKSKLHRGTVTEANLNYIGSITIDEDLMEAANLYQNEKVQVVNINTGARIETYVMVGKRNSGVMCLNGAAARLFMKDDLIIVMAYARMSVEEAKSFTPRIVILSSENKISEKGSYTNAGKFVKEND